MKLISLFCLLFICYFGNSQEIDPRLILNKGDKAKQNFQYNKNTYNYWIFELDSSYRIVNNSSLSLKEKKSIQKNSNLNKDLIGTPQFNLFANGISLTSQVQYVYIDKKTVLRISSITEITTAFKTSPLNSKK